MFQEPFSFWDYYPYLFGLVLAFVVLWAIFALVRKSQIRKQGEPMPGFLGKAPSLFKILAVLTFLISLGLEEIKPESENYVVYELTAEGYQFVGHAVKASSAFRFADGSIAPKFPADLLTGKPVPSSTRKGVSQDGYSFLNSTPLTLTLFEVFYSCDAYNFTQDCSSPANAFLAEIPPYSYVTVCCKPRSWTGREEGPPRTVSLELGVDHSIVWMTWDEAQ